MKAKLRICKMQSTSRDFDGKITIEVMNEKRNMIADIMIKPEDFARILFSGGEINCEINKSWPQNLAEVKQ